MEVTQRFKALGLEMWQSQRYWKAASNRGRQTTAIQLQEKKH